MCVVKNKLKQHQDTKAIKCVIGYYPVYIVVVVVVVVVVLVTVQMCLLDTSNITRVLSMKLIDNHNIWIGS